MKRIVITALVLGLVFGAVATAEAGKKKKPKKTKRVVETVYDAPAIGSRGGVCLAATNSCGDIPTGPDEYFVTIEITDQTGLDVYATVGQDLDGDTFTDTSTTICGKNEEPIPIEPGIAITVFPWAVGRPSCPGVATTGTVKATLSNLP
ncbi:MAG: hypothetical protein M3277_11730 [Actinomycetota bacterium]|nr:hypothetical protein [Actinomycetota bacterium]